MLHVKERNDDQTKFTVLRYTANLSMAVIASKYTCSGFCDDLHKPSNSIVCFELRRILSTEN